MSSLQKIFNYITSSIAALIGIQSQKKREQDFNQKSAIGYLITGAILLVVFVISLILLVQLVMRLASP